MADLTRSASASMDASGATVPPISGLIAGADLEIGPCYIKASDGLVYHSNGTAANEAAKTDGWNARRGVKAGQPVTLQGKGVRFRYSTGLTPGARYYLSTTAGLLSDAATPGDAVGVAAAIDTTDIRVTRDV